MAYFRCSLGGGSGNGAVITVAYGAEFYNQTLTATNGVDTVSVVATSSGTADITVPSEGSWTISCTIGGDTYTSDPVAVDLSYDTTLTALPDGSTVLPTDDIQTWLECAGITDKAYTTLAEVLDDTDTYTTLLGDSNACDYMARSTTWASTIVADADAMRLLGMYDYACDALLGNSTWASAIAGSTYYESVLDVKVPTMTSNTTPSGVASASSVQSGYEAYKAFDGDTSTGWYPAHQFAVDDWLEYEFTNSVMAKVVSVGYKNTSSAAGFKYKIQGYDGTNWIDLSEEQTVEYVSQTVTWNTFIINTSNVSDTKYRLIITSNATSSSGNMATLQFYGRHTAQTNIIHSARYDTIYYLDNGTPVNVCTTDINTGIGVVDWSNLPTGDITLYSSVAKDPTDLTADYSKTIKVTKNKVEAYLMPDTVMYWYGFSSSDTQDCTSANGWSATPNNYTGYAPTHNTNDILISNSQSAGYSAIGAVRSLLTGAILKAVASCSNYVRVYKANSSKNVDLEHPIANDTSSTALALRSYTLASDCPNIAVGVDTGTRTITLKALWVE